MAFVRPPCRSALTPVAQDPVASHGRACLPLAPFTVRRLLAGLGAAVVCTLSAGTVAHAAGGIGLRVLTAEAGGMAVAWDDRLPEHRQATAGLVSRSGMTAGMNLAARWEAAGAALGAPRHRLMLGSLALPASSPWERWHQPVPDVPTWRWRHVIERPLSVGLDGARWDLMWRLDAVGTGARLHERRMTVGLSGTMLGWWPQVDDRLEVGVFHHRQTTATQRHGAWLSDAARFAGQPESARDWGLALGYGAQLSPAWYLGADMQWSARPGFSLISEERVSFGLRARWRF